MAMIKPTIDKILPFDATSDFVVTFSSIGGDQVYKNEIIIKKSSDNSVIYDNTVTSFSFSHTIPKNTLINATSYIISIITYDVSNNASLPSDSLLFWCFTNPIITIDNIVNGQVNAQNYIFQGSFTGTNIDTLQSYRYILYDNFKNDLIDYSEVFGSNLTQEIDGLSNNTDYYIQLLCMGQHGQQYQTDLIKFTANFISPLLNATLTLNNNKDKGAIDVIGNIIEIIGKVESGAVSYTSDWIDLKTGNATISFSEDVIMTSDFTIKLFAKNMDDNNDIIKIIYANGFIEVLKSDNRIHAYKYLNNSTLRPSHFASAETTMTNTSNLVIWLRSINGLIDVKVGVLS